MTPKSMIPSFQEPEGLRRGAVGYADFDPGIAGVKLSQIGQQAELQGHITGSDADLAAVQVEKLFQLALSQAGAFQPLRRVAVQDLPPPSRGRRGRCARTGRQPRSFSSCRIFGSPPAGIAASSSAAAVTFPQPGHRFENPVQVQMDDIGRHTVFPFPGRL